jgi:molybdopterin molybdotransferase
MSNVKKMITINEAIEIITQNVKPVNFEIVPIENALGRIAFENIFASIYLPRFNNSAMDGYALLMEDQSKEVRIKSTTLAGKVNDDLLEKGSVIKIMTGAKVPDNAQAVVPIETVKMIDDETLILPDDIVENQHIRFVGEDIRSGEVLVQNGETIDFSRIALCASQGVTHIKVFAKPRVAVFASGEELKLHFESLQGSQIYNSNTPSLMARSRELGADVTFFGTTPDSVESLIALINNANAHDLIITSGGVSVGEADYTKEAFEACGMECYFSKLQIKPGKPVVFGKIGKCYVLNLPGNPLASNLVFEVIGKLIIQVLKGSDKKYLNTIETVISDDITIKKGQYSVIPGFFDGRTFSAAKKSFPGMVSVLKECNGMIITDNEAAKIKRGSTVKFLPIAWEFFSEEFVDFYSGKE